MDNLKGGSNSPKVLEQKEISLPKKKKKKSVFNTVNYPQLDYLLLKEITLKNLTNSDRIKTGLSKTM